ncbi:hypothetical protein K4F52_003314 [Lecanicillium sp. MT-2017a]|nr:hypothetical protein K4F52_003314 [Lecanicillium sp. MT-2017a]
MDSKQDPSLLRPTPSHTNTIPHDPTENIPDAAYPESDYRPGTGYSSNASQTHLNRPQGSASPREASSSSSPTHLQPRQWPAGGGGGGGGVVGQAGPSNLPLEPPPPYEPSQSSPTTQSPLPSQATPSYGLQSQQTASSYGVSQQAPSSYTQSHPASSYTTQPYSQPPSSYAPSLARPEQYSRPQQTGASGNDIPMTNLSTTGVYGQNQNLGMSPQQPPGAGPVAGTENGGPKYGPAATRRRWGKRRFKICVFIVIAVIVLIIALVVGVALGVLRVQLDE